MVRHYLKILLGIQDDNDIQDPEISVNAVADASQVRLYVEENGAGPNLEDFRFYFVQTAKKEWNKQAISIAMAGFRAWMNAQPYDIGKFSDEYLCQMFVQRFEKLRQKWSEAQIKGDQTIEDVIEELDRKREILWRKERRRNRRHMVSENNHSITSRRALL